MNTIRKSIQKGLLVIAAIGIAVACTPQFDEVVIKRDVDMSLISRIELKPTNTQLIADGNAQLNFTPAVYVTQNKKEVRLLEDRVKKEWFAFSSKSGVEISELFSTDDKSLIGKTIDVTVTLKDKPELSSSTSFTVIAPLDASYRKEVTFPVVFHLIRTEEEIQNSGLVYEKGLFDNAIAKLNKSFAGSVSKNPVGTDTYIRFKAAEYNPSGTRLVDAGVNRVVVKKIGEDFDQLITEQGLLWNPRQYLNIWLITDPTEQNKIKFVLDNTYQPVKYPFLPAYKNKTTQGEQPAGLNLQEVADDTEFTVRQSGVIYRLQDLNGLSRSYDFFYGYAPGVNDLIHYLGSYFGLYPTNTFNNSKVEDDHCDDTIDYFISSKFFKSNKTLMKETETCYFMSENIMDDPTGVHTSISVEQTKRMRWVLENCPERSSWKSTYAFTGK